MAAPEAKNALTRGLGGFSLALGAAQLTAPRAVARLVGADPEGRTPTLMRLMGAREVAAGAGILARPRPAGWLWARVAGDALDLLLLDAAVVRASRSRPRLFAAMGLVAGAAAADVVEATRLSRVAAHETAEGAIHVRKAVTVNRSAEEAYGFWRDLGNLPRFMAHLESVQETPEGLTRWRASGPFGSVEWDAEIVEDRHGELLSWRTLPGADVDSSGSVGFVATPGGRSTEVVVELEYRPPAGGIGAAIAKLAGEDPPTQLADDLRRFKQVLETGEIARSDGTPHGHELTQHLFGQLRQRPARPAGGTRTTTGGGAR
ncbi:MAG TPA: SRPBCC family protein [Gaiellaceae bacterium]|nr:SRPBCC family protein [Gaiellaceae bacterium]